MVVVVVVVFGVVSGGGDDGVSICHSIEADDSAGYEMVLVDMGSSLVDLILEL